MAGVTINLLGGFAATVDGAPVADNGWRLRKARELVKLLALAPGPSRSTASRRWRRCGPTATLARRRTTCTRRSTSRGARSARGRSSCATSSSGWATRSRWTSTASSARRPTARREGSAAALRAARALYAGELLPENRYDDWVAGRREELAQLAASLADALGGLGPVSELRGLPTETSSFVGRGHELAELRPCSTARGC